MSDQEFNSIDGVLTALERQRYVAGRALATTIHLAIQLGKPMFIEGEPGVGKTELAKVIAAGMGAELIRLQCYEGLDVPTALYEWNYPRQMLEVRLQEARGVDTDNIGSDIFSEQFLLARPLLRAITAEGPVAPVLLIDEVDRADEEFEAFLLEVLSDFQITIPEIGTLKAKSKPLVILTSNRTRELHDALKRRCLYFWIDYPEVSKEIDIVRRRLPGIKESLARDVAFFMQRLRDEELYKRPGVAETLDWAEALLTLGLDEIDEEAAATTLGCILKHKGDIDRVPGERLSQIMEDARKARDFAEHPTTR